MRFLLFIAMLLISPCVWAVDNLPVSRSWEAAGFGGAGQFPMIVPDIEVTNKLYMTSDVAGNFFSVDGGDNWQYLNTGTTTIVNANIVQSEFNPDIMYSLGKKLIKSIDRGKNWTTVADYRGTRSVVHKTIAIGRTNPNLVFVGLDNGKIMRTQNGGQNWEEYATPFGANIKITLIYINPTDTHIIVGGQTTNGLIKYNLSNSTTTVVTPAGTNANYNWDYGTYSISAVERFCVTAGFKIACSTDLGANWTYTAAALADSNYIISRFAVKYLANTNIRFVLHGRQISTAYGTVYDYISNDSGSTWTSISTNVTMNTTDNPTEIWASFGSLGNVVSIAVDPNNENKWYATTDWRVFRSDDGGSTWTEKVNGAQNQVVSDIACAPNGRCFQSGMDIGLHYSDNNGDTWTAALPHTANGNPQGFGIAGFYWRVVTRGTLAEWNAGTGQVFVAFSQWSDFIPRGAVSNDNGVTWTIVTSGFPTTLLNSSGTKHEAAWGNGYPRALAKCSDDDDILAMGIDGYSGSENGGIFISTNGGTSWARTTQPDQWKTFNGIAFDPSDNACNTIIFTEFFYDSPDLPKTWRTTNRGTSWTAVETDIGVYDNAFDSNGKAFKVGLDTNPMIDRSTDGITWASMKKLNSTAQIADGLLVDPANPNIIFVGVNDGTNTGVSQGSGQTDGDGAGGGSVYITVDAQNGSSAVWYNITGDLPSPAGVTAFAINNYQGHYWLLAATDGSGVWRLRLDDTAPLTVSNLGFGN